MSEQSNAAKLKRWFLRALGPRLGQMLVRPTPAESAAILAHRDRPIAEHRTVVFALPLVGRHQVSDWSVVEERLQATLQSIARQTSTNWHVLLCGQDRPDALPDDSQHTFLPFVDVVDGHDKVPKLQQLVGALKELNIRDGLFMPFDADDLIAPDAVQNMQTRGQNGYLVEQGHILDDGTGAIARTGSRSLTSPLQKPFWKFCGSCAAFPYSLSDGTRDLDFFMALSVHEHRLYPHLAALAGMALHTKGAPDVLYVINHGENFETRRGRGGFKQRFVARFAIGDPKQIRASFGI